VSRPLRVFAAGLFAASAAFTAACGRHANSGSDVASPRWCGSWCRIGRRFRCWQSAGWWRCSRCGKSAGCRFCRRRGPGDGRVRGPRRGRTPRARSLAVSVTPPVLWSRTFSHVDVSFGGAADENGNLYWVEYDPPWSYQNPDPPAFLVSADSNDGQNRYRVSAPDPPSEAHARGRQCRLVSGSGGHCLCGRYGCSVVVARSDLRSANWYDGIGWMTDLATEGSPSRDTQIRRVAHALCRRREQPAPWSGRPHRRRTRCLARTARA